MRSIADVDKNFTVKTSIEQKDMKFYDPKKAPFSIFGVYHEDGEYKRLPADVAKATSDGVFWLHNNTAGGRIRFRTDSNYVAIQAKMSSVAKMSGFAMTGSSAFDMYAVNADGFVYVNSFMPNFNYDDSYESIIYFSPDPATPEMREITINFPLYSAVEEVYVGISESAKLEECPPYEITCPIVYYGSSITQGGCASRPGNTYDSLISRRFNADFINLGFAGNAKAEDAIAEYVASLDMSVFVYDYDYNAPSREHLEATHEKMFLKIREAHPNLPVIMMSKPLYVLSEDSSARLAIIEKTYNNAKARGDENVYLISGPELMKIAGCEGLVDACHPNDLGFYSMYEAVSSVMEKIFAK